jgi:hypothetical protein
MKRSAKPRIRPVPRPIFSISREQFTHLLEGMPEKYRGLVRNAVEAKAPLSSNGLSDRERVSVLYAFKRARESASLSQLIFHDLTRINITDPASTKRDLQ